MLPESLSNDACSLVPNKERLCIIVSAKIDILGKIISSKIIRGIIRSRARLTYKEVESYIKKKCTKKEDYHETLKNLELAYLVLSKKSKNYGPLTIQQTELKEVSSRKILNALNQNNKKVIISIKCATKDLDVRIPGRKSEIVKHSNLSIYTMKNYDFIYAIIILIKIFNIFFKFISFRKL